MRRFLLLFAFLSAAVCGISQKQILDLQTCIDLAKQQNLNIRKSGITVEQQKLSNLQSKEDFLPSLSANLGQNFYFGRSLNDENIYQPNNSASTSVGVNGSLTLFNGLQRLNNVKKTKFDYEAALKDYQRQSDDICLQVMSQYLNVLYYKRQLEVTKLQLELSQDQYRKTRVQVRAGSLPEGDLIEAQAQVRSDEYEVVQMQSELQNQLVSLGELIYIDDFDNFDISDDEQLPASDILEMTVRDIYDNAIGLLPSVQAEEMRIKSAEKQLKVEKGAYSPTLTFNAGYSNSYLMIQDNPAGNAAFLDQLNANSAFSVGFSLNIPIFDQMRTPNAVKNAKLSLQDQKLDFEIAKYNLYTEIQNAYNNALNAKAKMVSAEAAVKSNKEAFEYQKAKYESGASSVYDYNQSRLDYTQSLSQQVQAKFEYVFRTKILSYYNGDLIF